MHVQPAGIEYHLPPASGLDLCVSWRAASRDARLLMIVTIYRDSHDTIRKGTNNCEIPAISIITLNELLSDLFLR